MSLRLQPVQPSHGARWVRQGFQVFLRRPLGFGALLLSFFFISMAVSVLLPWVGSLLALMAVPLLSLGFMMATQTALRGGPVHPGQLVEPLVRSSRPVRIELLKLCLGYALALIGIILLTEATAGNPWQTMASVVNASQSPTPEQAQAVMEDAKLLYGTLLMSALVSLLSIPFWHAPALVLWGEQSAAQSLFSSTLACWKTKGAFTVYGLVWLALMLGATVFTTLLFALLGLPQMAMVAMLPIALTGMTAFYVSLYFTFVDTFAPSEGRPIPPA